MNNPLTEEQKKRLFEISKLSPDKQKEEWGKFVKTLNKEQIEFLNKQQEKCPFCAIVKKEIKAYVVYEDEDVMGVLDINPANKGHVLLFPLEHTETILDLKKIDHIFSVAKKLSESIMKGLGAKGMNILVSNGLAAGQLVPHFAINLIPRNENDGLSFMWKPKKFSEEEMEEVKNLIKKNITEEVIEIKGPKEIYREIERVP